MPLRPTIIVATLSILIWWAQPAVAYGASVKAKLKKRSVVVINEGKNSGVKVGDEVCFVNNQETTIGCGKVRRVQTNRSFVFVKRPLFQKVRRGMIATYDNPNNNQAQPTSQFIGLSLAGYINIYPLYRTSVPIYETSEPPYWEEVTDKDKQFPQFRFKRAPVGGLAGEITIIPIRTTLGGRYDLVNSKFEWNNLPYEPKSSVGGTGCCYTNLSFNESSWGTWLQYLHPFKLAPDIEFAIGLGLDLDRSKLTISYDFFNDSNSGLTRNRLLENAEFVLYSIGARIVPIRLTLLLGRNMGIFIEGSTVHGFYGIYRLNPGEETQDPNTADTTSDRAKILDEYVKDYFKEALNHRPAGWKGGAMAHMGIQFSF